MPYIVAEYPITLTIKRIGPKKVLPFLVVSWGLVTCLQGLVTSYSGILAVRFFLGACEGGLLPGIVTYMSMYEVLAYWCVGIAADRSETRFWVRHKMQLRLSVFFTATLAFLLLLKAVNAIKLTRPNSSLAGAFAGLLAAAILNIKMASRPSWAAIFFIEGGFTIFFGLLAIPFLPDSIQTCWWLSQEQRNALEKEQELDLSGESETTDAGFSWDQVRKALLSPQVIFVFVLLSAHTHCSSFRMLTSSLTFRFISGCLLYGLAYFSASIVQGLGHVRFLTCSPEAPRRQH